MPGSTHIDHARHDPDLIAGHAAGDLSDTDRRVADALIAACAPCAELRRDLVAIAAATRSLPAPAASARDFRLEPAQAERLRRGSWLRRVLRPFAAPSGVRPLAAAFTSLGVAGLFVAIVLPGMFMMGAASAPAERDLGQAAGTFAPAAAPVASPATGGEFGGLVPNAQATLDAAYAQSSAGPRAEATNGTAKDGATTPPEVAVGGGTATEDTSPDEGGNLRSTTDASPTGLLIAGSLALLGAGLLLFVLRFAGRRIR
jgi:hypothetical protein